ncbi:hypothetical protein HA466_0125920 [Hirschfeldia incana]|nr:hypothetical protein HA466_0125920 [Hirschfeldia incana]
MSFSSILCECIEKSLFLKLILRFVMLENVFFECQVLIFEIEFTFFFFLFGRIWFVKMASKLVQVQSKACEASKFVAKHGSSYYRQLLEKNKHYIQEPATVEKCQELSKQLLYTRLASIPKRYETFWKEVDYAKNLWKNRSDLKVEDAGIAALFGLECFAWYCAGEIAGRGFTFTGYYP